MNLIRRLLVRLFGFRFARVGDRVYCRLYKVKGIIQSLAGRCPYEVIVVYDDDFRCTYTLKGYHWWNERTPSLKYIGGK